MGRKTADRSAPVLRLRCLTSYWKLYLLPEPPSTGIFTEIAARNLLTMPDSPAPRRKNLRTLLFFLTARFPDVDILPTRVLK